MIDGETEILAGYEVKLLPRDEPPRLLSITMSLHATISPKAEQRLRFEKRISTLSSITISLLAIALVGLVLAYILLPSLFVESPVIVTYSAEIAAEEEVKEKPINHQVQRKPSAPSSAMAKVIASAIPSATVAIRHKIRG